MPGKINVKNNRKGKAYIDAQAFFAKMNGESMEQFAATSDTSSQELADMNGQNATTSLTITAPFIRTSSKSWMDQLKEKHGVLIE